MQGLTQAFGKYLDDDPLGIGLRQRSVEGEQEATDIPFGTDDFGIQHHQNNVNLMNARTDPQGFITMMQAINERAPGGIQNPGRRGDPLSGLRTARLGQPSTYDPATQGSAVDPYQKRSR